MAIWTQPKVDWVSSDRFNIGDYNRIKNNIEYLHEQAVSLFKEFAIEDMGEDITSYLAYWDADSFNAFESNIDLINKNILTKDYGQRLTFYANGLFITWEELNRIESASLSMYEIINRAKAGLRRLSFRLGTKRGGF